MTKVGIVTVTYNAHKLLSYQIDCFKQYCLSDYELIVIDNSSNVDEIYEIKNICFENDVKYFGTYFSVKIGNIPSTNHGLALNFAYESFKNKFDYLLFVDHDLFPIKHFDVEDILGENIIAGCEQKISNIKYLWPGLIILGKIDESFDFTPKPPLDTGGRLSDFIKKNENKVLYLDNKKIETNTKFKDRFMHDFYWDIHGGTFMHFINASNWSNSKIGIHNYRIENLLGLLNNTITKQNTKDMKKILISDFTIKEIPHGGSEWVNEVIINKFGLDFEYSQNVSKLDPNNFYIISNISLMNPYLVKQIPNLNYIILENDYKICHSRHPWRYPNSIIPKSERINYDLYENAKAVFVQTTDHLNVFLSNEVNANFVNLESSIWSEDDLNMIESLINQDKNGKYGIYYTNNWIKNTQGNLKYCSEHRLPFHILKESNDRYDFLKNLSKCSGLVFYPLARETFCRLVVEAKCLGLDVITSKNYGATLEPWFDNLNKQELISFLKKNTEKNLNKISEYIK